MYVCSIAAIATHKEKRKVKSYCSKASIHDVSISFLAGPIMSYNVLYIILYYT